jgi:hypothetical protein
MEHTSSSATITVALLGTDALYEGILARVLEREGYSVRHLSVRHLEAHPKIFADEVLEDADILLLAPGLQDGAREAFLGEMRGNPRTASIPVLPISSTLKQALLDELSAGAPWGGFFEELTTQIGDALTRAPAWHG